MLWRKNTVEKGCSKGVELAEKVISERRPKGSRSQLRAIWGKVLPTEGTRGVKALKQETPSLYEEQPGGQSGWSTMKKGKSRGDKNREVQQGQATEACISNRAAMSPTRLPSTGNAPRPNSGVS